MDEIKCLKGEIAAYILLIGKLEDELVAERVRVEKAKSQIRIARLALIAAESYLGEES